MTFTTSKLVLLFVIIVSHLLSCDVKSSSVDSWGLRPTVCSTELYPGSLWFVPLQTKDSTVHATNEVCFTKCTAIKTTMRICSLDRFIGWMGLFALSEWISSNLQNRVVLVQWVRRDWENITLNASSYKQFISPERLLHSYSRAAQRVGRSDGGFGSRERGSCSLVVFWIWSRSSSCFSFTVSVWLLSGLLSIFVK